MKFRADVTRSFSWKLLFMKTRVCYYIINKRHLCVEFSSKNNHEDLYMTNMNIDALFSVSK